MGHGNRTSLSWRCHTRAAPSCDMFNRGSSYFHVPLTTVCHLLTVAREGPNHAVINMYRKFCEIWMHGFWDMLITIKVCTGMGTVGIPRNLRVSCGCGYECCGIPTGDGFYYGGNPTLNHLRNIMIGLLMHRQGYTYESVMYAFNFCLVS